MFVFSIQEALISQSYPRQARSLSLSRSLSSFLGIVGLVPPRGQELALEDRLIDSKTVEAEYAEQVAELARRVSFLFVGGVSRSGSVFLGVLMVACAFGAWGVAA